MTTPLLHVDVDAFSVAVERRDDPGLLGRPVAVVGLVVLSASYEAREFGLRPGMRAADALRLCPSLVSVPSRFDAYTDASDRLFALLRSYGEIEAGSMDEAFLAVPDLTWDRAGEFGAAVRARVWDELGLPVSVGVGRTKLMAKVAGRRAKPGGVVVIGPAAEPAVRDGLRITELWGVGEATRGRLADAGIGTVAELRERSLDDLVAVAGTAMGRRLHRIATGTDDATVRRPGPRRSVSVSRAMPLGRPSAAHLAKLAGRVTEKLRGTGARARLVRLALLTEDGEERARQRLSPHSDDEGAISRAVLALAAELGPPPCRRIVVTLAELKFPDPGAQNGSSGL